MKIIIDPGHGGHDSGAYYKGIHEKNINLAVSLRLKALMPYETVLTRQTDIYLPLSERVTNINKDDIFVSIHCNACEESTPNGFEVWHYKSYKSERLTDNLLSSMKKELTMFGDRGKRDTMALYVLKKSPCVSALIECGFLSNDNDRKLLIQDYVQNLIANSIKNGIVSYLNASN